MAEIGKPKREFPLELVGDDVKEAVREFSYDRMAWAFDTFERYEREEREAVVTQEAHEHFDAQFEGREREIDDALYAIKKEIMRGKILDAGVRPAYCPAPTAAPCSPAARPRS